MAEDLPTTNRAADFGPLPVRVLVCDAVTRKIQQTRFLDYNNLDERAWIKRTIVWALLNSRTIEIEAATANLFPKHT